MVSSTASESERRRPTRRSSWALRGLTVLCLAAAVMPFVLPAIPVTSDVPKHTLVARVWANYHDAPYSYASHFEREVRPKATMLSELVLAALIKFLDPLVAAKLYIALLCAGLWLTSRFLVNQLGQPPEPVLLLLPLSHSYFVFAGFLPFVASMVLYPALL